MRSQERGRQQELVYIEPTYTPLHGPRAPVRYFRIRSRSSFLRVYSMSSPYHVRPQHQHQELLFGYQEWDVPFHKCQNFGALLFQRQDNLHSFALILRLFKWPSVDVVVPRGSQTLVQIAKQYEDQNGQDEQSPMQTFDLLQGSEKISVVLKGHEITTHQIRFLLDLEVIESPPLSPKPERMVLPKL